MNTTDIVIPPQFKEMPLTLYIEDLKGRTFSLLYFYEQQPFGTYQKRAHDLLEQVGTFSVLIELCPTLFSRYLENIAVIVRPNPLDSETEHDFVRRHILNAVNIADSMLDQLSNKGGDKKSVN